MNAEEKAYLARVEPSETEKIHVGLSPKTTYRNLKKLLYKRSEKTDSAESSSEGSQTLSKYYTPIQGDVPEEPKYNSLRIMDLTLNL